MLKVVFAGTPDFAKVALEAIVHAGHEVVMVMTQPDRPAGRGMQLHASPVKQFCFRKKYSSHATHVTQGSWVIRR